MASLFSVDLLDPHAISLNKRVNVGMFRSKKEAEIFVVKHIVGYHDQDLIDFFITESELETNETY